MLRRELLTKTLLSTLSLTLFAKVFGRTALAQAGACELGATPKQGTGPFYPTDHLPHDVIDNDADLVTLEGNSNQAKGKVVFTGAEKEFEVYYNLKEKVNINAKPDLEYLITTLSYLIENPSEISAIGLRAREFIEKEHDFILSAKKYLNTWNQ